MIKTQNFGSSSFSRTSYVKSLRPDPRLTDIEAKAAELIKEVQNRQQQKVVEINTKEDFIEHFGKPFESHVTPSILMTDPAGEVFALKANFLTEPPPEEETVAKLNALGINPNFLTDFSGNYDLQSEIKDLQEDMPEDIMFPVPIGTLFNFVEDGKLVVRRFDGTGWNTLDENAQFTTKAPRALDLANERRLIEQINKSVSKAIELSVFEPNDAATRDQVAKMIESYLADLNTKGMITDYTVVCDETNNPPSDIPRNEIHVHTEFRLAGSKETVCMPAFGWSCSGGAEIDVASADGITTTTSIHVWPKTEGAGSKVEKLPEYFFPNKPIEPWAPLAGIDRGKVSLISKG